MIFPIADAKHGLEKVCPSCSGLIWINTSWPGLPIWTLDSSGNSDREFCCAWCDSILSIINNDIRVIETRFSNKQINSDDLLIINEQNLSILIEDILLRSSSRIGNSDNFILGKSFFNKDQLKMWIKTISSKIRESKKILRMPVYEQ